MHLHGSYLIISSFSLKLCVFTFSFYVLELISPVITRHLCPTAPKSTLSFLEEMLRVVLCVRVNGDIFIWSCVYLVSSLSLNIFSDLLSRFFVILLQ